MITEVIWVDDTVLGNSDRGKADGDRRNGYRD